jgi:hypothetical protein
LLLLITSVAVAGCGARPAASSGERGESDKKPEKISLGGAYLPAGFGDGSLWATDILTCDDTGVEGGACAVEAGMPIKRLDPQTGEEQAAVELEDFFANTTEVAFGAGSAWVSSADWATGPVEKRQLWHAVYRIDPDTNQVVDRIPVDSPSGVAFGHGSVWAVSAGHGTVSRIDPGNGEVAAKITVGRGAVDVAVDEGTEAVWTAGLYLPKSYDGTDAQGDPGANKLSRIDSETNQVVAEIPVRTDSPDPLEGGAQNVAVGGGTVWAASVDGRLLKVDQAKDEIVAAETLGEYSSDLKVSGGSVWATVQDSGALGGGERLKQVDPRTDEVVRTRRLGPVDSGGYGRLAADGDRVWFVEGSAVSEKGTLARISQ